MSFSSQYRKSIEERKRLGLFSAKLEIQATMYTQYINDSFPFSKRPGRRLPTRLLILAFDGTRFNRAESMSMTLYTNIVLKATAN